MENLELNFLWKHQQWSHKVCISDNLEVKVIWFGQLCYVTKKSSDDKDMAVKGESDNLL